MHAVHGRPSIACFSQAAQKIVRKFDRSTVRVFPESVGTGFMPVRADDLTRFSSVVVSGARCGARGVRGVYVAAHRWRGVGSGHALQGTPTQ